MCVSSVDTGQRVSVGSLARVHGTCDKRFETVRTALAESLDGDDVGASAAGFVDGEPVADLWGGHQDAKCTRPWDRRHGPNL
jgi:hypothetical protein